jgi:hypothetical protein
MGIRTGSEQSVTSATLLPVVQMSPENWKVVRPCGSQRGCPAVHDDGHRDALVLVTNVGPSTGDETSVSCPDPSPEPDSCRSPWRTGSVKTGFACT